MTLTFALGPWTFAWTSLLSLVITPEYFMMIPWWEHSEKGVADRRTDGRMDGQTEVFSELLGHIEMYSNVSDNCLSMSGNCQICFMNTGTHFPKKKIMHFLTRKLYIYIKNMIKKLFYGHSINTLRQRQNGHQFADNIFKCISLNKNIRTVIKMSLKFAPSGPINNIPALVQIVTRHWPGYKPLSEPMMVRLPMYIYITRPQWVKIQTKFCRQLLTIFSEWPSRDGSSSSIFYEWTIRGGGQSTIFFWTLICFIFRIIKALFTYKRLHSYLTGVTTA